jgi:hypothetical protein
MVLPFQDASRGFLDPGPDGAEPPATQYVAETHERVLIPAATSSGSAAGCAFHSLPFHVSITLLSESIEEAIVMQSLALTQDRPSMVSSPPLAGGAGIVFSVLPFQATANP